MYAGGSELQISDHADAVRRTLLIAAIGLMVVVVAAIVYLISHLCFGCGPNLVTDPTQQAIISTRFAPLVQTITADAASVRSSPQAGLLPGSSAPEFSTTLLTGTVSGSKAVRGKVVLLNFWATWCGPCRTEMPFFQKLADANKERGLIVLAVNNRETPETIQPFLDEYGLHFNIGLDRSGKINTQYEVRQYPTTYVLDRNGVILARQFGPFDEAALEAALSGWLK